MNRPVGLISGGRLARRVDFNDPLSGERLFIYLKARKSAEIKADLRLFGAEDRNTFGVIERGGGNLQARDPLPQGGAHLSRSARTLQIVARLHGGEFGGQLVGEVLADDLQSA